jgi:hypothetical protein
MDGAGNQPELETMLGGSGAPENEAPPQSGAGDETQAAAWTSQLSKELREDKESFSKIAGFKTISELVGAYLQGGEKEPEEYELKLDAGMEGFSSVAKNAKLTKDQAEQTLDGWKSMLQSRESAFIKAAAEKAPAIAKELTDEFGAEAAAYHRKAVSDGLNQLIAKSGLGANKNLARALCLLGREMSEDSTPAAGGKPAITPKTVKEGAMFPYS